MGRWEIDWDHPQVCRTSGSIWSSSRREEGQERGRERERERERERREKRVS